MTRPLEDKVVIVTGASSGVGEAAARTFARKGAKVVLAARSAQKIRKLAKEVGGLAVPTDVCSLEDLEALVANDLEPARIAEVIDTNLKAPMLLTRLALPHLRKSRGVVVNVASIAGHVPLPHESPYCASKWGLRGFTFAVRQEMRDTGVSLCVVSPGPIATPFVLDDLDHVPDLVFSQPILTADEVRAIPAQTLALAKVASAFPWVQEMLRPSLEAKGARVKERLRREAKPGAAARRGEP